MLVSVCTGMQALCTACAWMPAESGATEVRVCGADLHGPLYMLLVCTFSPHRKGARGGASPRSRGMVHVCEDACRESLFGLDIVLKSVECTCIWGPRGVEH